MVPHELIALVRAGLSATDCCSDLMALSVAGLNATDCCKDAADFWMAARESTTAGLRAIDFCIDVTDASMSARIEAVAPLAICSARGASKSGVLFALPPRRRFRIPAQCGRACQHRIGDGGALHKKLLELLGCRLSQPLLSSPGCPLALGQAWHSLE